jgi:predicted Zn finger-like uncharacterized protein
MKESISCPNCDASFSVSRENEGKRAKCAKCQHSFTIAFAKNEPDLADLPGPPSEAEVQVSLFTNTVLPPAIPKPKAAVIKPSPSRKIEVPLWAMISGPAVVALIAGYFAGREHVKYEIRSSLAGVASAFTKGMANAPLGLGKDSASKIGDAKSTSEIKKPSPPVEPKRQYSVGESAREKGFAITLKDARIDFPEVKDLMGEKAKGKDPVLVLNFDFMNIDDRRILRFKGDNRFSASHFRVRDDVDNVIRGVDYGFGNKAIGALTSSDDIEPGESASHVEFFTVPPPKTKFLILTVDLACLGGEGEIQFKIPSDAISR